MKERYKNYLFEKHILVAENNAVEQNEKDTRFDVLYTLGNRFGIRITEGAELVQPQMIRMAAEQLGERVPEPFYRGFPESVREMSSDALIYDQLMHYMLTYGADAAGITLSEEMQERRKYSMLEREIERTAFREEVPVKDFSILSEEAAEKELQKLVDQLLASSRPLSEDQYSFVREYILDTGYKPEHIASKNTAILLLLDTGRDVEFAKAAGLRMSDIPKVLDEMLTRDYAVKNIKNLNLKNQDRKFLTALIRVMEADEKTCDITNCYERQQVWAGLLHHLHYQAKSEGGKEFLAAMRGDENHSVYARFEKEMGSGNLRGAIDILQKEKGSAAVLRNLNYLLSRCETPEDMQKVADSIGSKNAIVLTQLLMQYSQYQEIGAGPRTFKFVKHNKMTVHAETSKEIMHRRSHITVGQAHMLAEQIRKALAETLKGRVGKVYIDPDMERMALPLQEATSQGGFGVLPKGTRIPLSMDQLGGKDGNEPKQKKLRAFTYWEKVNDIDLSCFGLNKDGSESEFSWRTMSRRQSGAITYSGDETRGYNGGSEYFDIDLTALRQMYPDMKYMVFCNNVFSGIPFNQCVCRAGYMLRDIQDTGEIYEPKTVQSSFTIDCESTFAYLFGIDVERGEFVWLNIARDSEMRVAGMSTMDFLRPYFQTTDILNVKSFFEMAALEVVDSPEKADVIVSDKEVQVPEGVEQIHSFDTERIMEIMNKSEKVRAHSLKDRIADAKERTTERSEEKGEQKINRMEYMRRVMNGESKEEAMAHAAVKPAGDGR